MHAMADTDDTQVYLPDFCAAGTVFVVVLVAELMAIAVTLAAHTPGSEFLLALARTSFFVQWVALLGTAVMCQLRGWLEKTGKTRAFVISFLVLEALCLIVAELAWQIPIRIVGVSIERIIGDQIRRQRQVQRCYATQSQVKEDQLSV